MSNGDDEQEADAETEIEAVEEEGETASLADHLDAVDDALDADAVDEEALGTALDALEAGLEVAETEDDLDEVEAAIDDAASALEGADLPEPEDEDEEAPSDAIEERIEDLRGALEEARGPYAEDAVDAIEEASATVADTRWTEAGEGEVLEAAVAFVEAVEDALDADLAAPEGLDAVPDALEAAGGAIEAAGLDPDDDAETVAALVEAADALTAGVEDAEEWDDLSTREQLRAEGFYEVLDHRKDYPPEWHALKVWEQRGNAEMVLMALEKLGSEFMEEHCLDALRRMGDEAALEPMLERAERRDRPAIEILGKIGSDEAVETLLEYVGTDTDPGLQKTTLKALGEIGSEEATGTVANALAAENELVRSRAARSLGLIGDTRAIEPLLDTLESDDSDTVRASAAWALNQIGTERALAGLAEYRDDRTYLVQAEAEKATAAVDGAEA